MLKRVEFINYRCLPKTSLVLSPLTVLVGPNASGKTSVLDALAPQRTLRKQDRWQRVGIRDIRIDYHIWGRVDTRKMEQGLVAYKHQALRLRLRQMRSPNQAQHTPQLCSDGGNLANLFASLSRKDQERASTEFCRLVRCFKDVDVRPLTVGNQRLLFQDSWAADLWYEPDEVSDGSILSLAFVLLKYQADRPQLITIEEPERGLHPYLIGQVVSLLRDLANGVHGEPVQVVMATHSAELLDALRPEEVRFLQRHPETGAVTIQHPPTDAEGWEEAYAVYQRSLGNAWLSGGLGGVPGV